MNLDQYRDQVVLDLRAALGAGFDVGTHPGAMSLKDVRAYAMQAPAVRVAVMSAEDRSDSAPQLGPKTSVFAITKHGKGGRADALNLRLVSQLAAIAQSQLLGGSRPSKPGYQNLYSAELGEEGIALGAVSWSQLVELDPPVDPESLPDFLRLFQTIDPAPAVAGVDATDNINVRGT